MKRMTMWYDRNHAICENEECSLSRCPFADPVCEQTQSIIDSLAAYEDTGLEPEDLKRSFNEDTILKLAGQALDVSAARLRELAQADREGRCVVLSDPMKPMVCKPNDTDVYCPACGKTLSGGWPLSDADDLRKLCQCPNCGQSIDDTKCEEAEAALRREQDG